MIHNGIGSAIVLGCLTIWLFWQGTALLRSARRRDKAATLPAHSNPPTPVTNPTWFPPQTRFPARVNVICTRCGCARAGTFCSQCGLRLLHHTGGPMLAADYMAEERRTKPAPPEDPEWREVIMERTVVIEPGLPPVMTRRYVPR